MSSRAGAMLALGSASDPDLRLLRSDCALVGETLPPRTDPEASRRFLLSSDLADRLCKESRDQ